MSSEANSNPGGELRARGSVSARNDPLSGDEDNAESSCQKTGWLRLRATRLNILGKRTSYIFAAVVLLIFATTMIVVVALPYEDIKLVSSCADVHRT